MNFCNILKMRNILISEPAYFSVTTCTEGVKSLCQPCLTRTECSLKTHNANYFFLQPCWGDNSSDASSRSLSNPTILAPTQGQTQVSNPACKNLWHVSCPSRDAWVQQAQASQEQWPESRRDSLGCIQWPDANVWTTELSLRLLS